MAAGRYNFSIEKGTTFRQTIVWKDKVGNPVDVTNYLGRMQLRDKLAGTDTYDLTNNNGGIVFNSPYGQIALYIPASITGAFTQARYIYDLDLTAPNGDVIRLLRGQVKILEGVQG